MRVTVNGRHRSYASALSVDDLVATVVPSAAAPAGGRRGVAVAVNGEVVPRSQWAETVLADGDSIEVLSAAQGG
jgi:sulfur carrier protein